MRALRIFSGVLVLALAACAGAPPIKVIGAAPSSPPPGASSFRIAALGEEGRAPSPIERLVSERLAAKGFSPALGEAPRYSVHVAYSARPDETRAYLPSEATAQAAPAAWLMGDADKTRDAHVYSLVVQIVEVATGDEAYRVAAAVRAPEGGGERVASQLVAAAFAEQSMTLGAPAP